MLGLARQQLRFSRRSPTITGQGAIFTHHPVAGNNHRQRIRRAGAGHGSYRPRLANMLCHLAVAAGLAHRDLPQRLPDLQL